jgi:hypothetical protein
LDVLLKDGLRPSTKQSSVLVRTLIELYLFAYFSGTFSWKMQTKSNREEGPPPSRKLLETSVEARGRTDRIAFYGHTHLLQSTPRFLIYIRKHEGRTRTRSTSVAAEDYQAIDV